MKWKYIAQDINHVKIKGQIEAKDKKVLRKLLANQKYVLLKAKEIKNKKQLAPKKKMKMHELSNFCRQWAAMISSGLEIALALQVINNNTNNKNLKAILTTLNIEISKGSDIWKAFDNYRTYFNHFFINMVRIGEMSGNLVSVLEQLALYYDSQNSLKQKTKQSLQYPKILLMFCLIVIIVIIVYILPIFVNLFSTMNVKLPKVLARINILSIFIRAQWQILLAILLTLVLTFKILLRKLSFKYQIDRLKFKIPIINRLMIINISSRFTRALALMLTSGVPITTSLEMIKHLMNNSYFEGEMQKAIIRIYSGESLASSLAKTKIIRKDLIEIIKMGEESGNLAQVLHQSSAYFDQQVLMQMLKLIGFIEPMMISFVALIVVLIMSIVFFPLMDLIRLQM